MAGQTYAWVYQDLKKRLCGPKTTNKEKAIKLSSCLSQKISKFSLGMILVAAALAMTVVSFTLLPVIGLVLGGREHFSFHSQIGEKPFAGYKKPIDTIYYG